MKTIKKTSDFDPRYYCARIGGCCEYANSYGSCLATACRVICSTGMEVTSGSTDYRIVHRKDEIYDLFDSTSWIMSRGCIDDILNFLSTTSKYSAIRIVFEDESFGKDN